MNTWPSLYREGALALAPDNVADGNKQLDDLIDRAAESIRKREALQVGFYGFSAAMFVTSCVVHVLATYRQPPLALEINLTLFTGLSSIVMLALTWWGWTAIQHRRFAKGLGGLSGLTIPDPLQRLIYDFATGVREVRTARGDTVPPRLFASRWAIMLFSHDPRQRLLVRGPRGEKHEPQIFAEPDQPKIVLPDRIIPGEDASEPPLRNLDPAMAWLVDGSINQFATGLDRFLDTLPPHQVEAYRLILTVARRELRKGGQPGAQEAAIRIILAELESSHRLIRGTSRATIMQLIHAQHRKKDISGYFALSKDRELPMRQTDQDSFG